MRNPLLPLLIAVFLSASLPAQTQTASSDSRAASGGSAKQSAEMAKLSRVLLGTWKGELGEGPATSKPALPPAEQTVTLGPAGNSLVQNFRGGTAEKPVIGHGVLWWDDNEQVYRALWCDSDLPSGCRNPSAGTWSGDDLIFRSQREVNGRRFSSRAVYTEIKPDSFTFFFEIRTDDGPPTRVLNIPYRRAR